MQLQILLSHIAQTLIEIGYYHWKHKSVSRLYFEENFENSYCCANENEKQSIKQSKGLQF